GSFGVDPSVEVARRHPAEVKSLVLLSGDTFPDGLQFLQRASQLPGLFVMSDDDEYPPTQEAMELLYITSSNPGKKFVHYSEAREAPWIWYETSDASKVPAKGGHGTDMFKPHPELPGIIVNWFVTTLIKTPGHAPADTVACAATIDQIRKPGGVAQVTQQLVEARRKNPEAQLFPEVTVSMIGQGYMRVGEPKLALEVFKLNLLAYPESADANDNLADAYLANGQKDLADSTLTIRVTKFYKTRRIALGRQLRGVLAEYDANRRLAGHPRDDADSFFTYKKGEPVARMVLEDAFLRLRQHVGIGRQNARYQPRLHDLRHTFAVHRLIAWYRTGADVQRLLPGLSTHMGHISLSGTQRYLTMTPELLTEASLRFEHYAGEVIHGQA